MKLTIVLALLLTSAAAITQSTGHNVTLTWTDTLNPTGTTYTVYRATGLCSTAPVFSAVATGLTAMTYQDTSVSPGKYCYRVTATYNGVESQPSGMVNPLVPSFAPTALTVQHPVQ